jgi:predicted alpha/beta hydrolase
MIMRALWRVAREGDYTFRTLSSPSTHTIRASDGVAITATLYPATGSARRVVVINAAMGVPGRFYSQYARFLAEHGLTAITWDYRGMGSSAPPRLRGFAADIDTWAERDLAALIDWVDATWPNARLLMVGQSLGGQILSLPANRERIGAAMLVSCPSGHWGHWPAPGRYGMWTLAMLGLPLGASLLGYFPAKRLGLGEDLPAGVARQWSRWIRSPRYNAGDARYRERMASFRIPIRAYSFTDDGYAPAAAIAALLAEYPSASIEHRRVDPAALGMPPVGHHGFFRERQGGRLWKETAAWLSRA